MIFVSRKTIEKAVHGLRYDGGWVGFEATVCVPDCFISLDLSHEKMCPISFAIHVYQ